MIDVPVAAKPMDNPPSGWLRALYDWLTGAAPAPPTTPDPVRWGYLHMDHHLRQFGA